jgi:transcriptional regulator with XRE-family HTH domain
MSREDTDEETGRLSSLSIGVRLRDARNARGLTCAELAHLAGISHGSVSFIETGKNQPRTDTVERLARALKVPRAWLAFGDGRKPDFAKGRE